MAVKPLNWISWREARDRMPQIWDGWRYQPAHADQAMVKSLRRGKVPYRGKAFEPGSYRTNPIALQNVVAGLLSLRNPPFAASFAQAAEYETTEWGLALGGGTRPFTAKKTAELDGVELAWTEFRDDLIRFELPAGMIPSRSRGPQPNALRRYEAADHKLFPEIRRLKKADQLSVSAAALKLARGAVEGKTVAGSGTAESRAKRLTTLFLREQRVLARRN
jgi:hypothetical protein